MGADADTALVEEIAVTPANINDGKAGPDALPGNLGEVFADSAYRGNHFGCTLSAKGRTPRIVASGMWGRDEAETLACLKAWNQPIHRIRGRIEKVFGTWKRSYGLRRMRCCPINERFELLPEKDVAKDNLFAIRLYARLSFVA